MTDPAPEKITATEIELALSGYFDSRRNFIIPNVKWGFRNLRYEIDLMVVTQSLYAYEVEIKISPGDLKRDREKLKWNYCGEQHYFRKSFFAIPEKMLKYQDLVPEKAGILAVSYNSKRYWFDTRLVREPVTDTLAKKVTETELAQLGRLTMLRMWDLKRNIRTHAQQKRELRKQLEAASLEAHP